MSRDRRYLALGAQDVIARHKGDQFQDSGNGLWILARSARTGTRPATGETWRRPVRCKSDDTREETARPR